MSTIYDDLYRLCAPRAKHTIWVFSDLQQGRYENAKRCLDISMRDYLSLGAPAEMIWYLGDSTEGHDLGELERMTAMQEEAFLSLGIPLCYATGNHDYDYAEYCHKNGIASCRMPFYEMVKQHPGWHTTPDVEDTWFKITIGNYCVYFFTDHMARDGSWCSTHNGDRWGGEAYPYTREHFAAIREDMNRWDGPIITASHCAFPGGNRETRLLSCIQPLPVTTRLHLYGHAHIGEYRCPKERVFSQIQWIDWQDIPQIDVASFENIRGSWCRSVLLHIYEDDSLGVFFRNHDEGRFVSAFFPARTSAETPGNYEKRAELSHTPW